MEEGEEETPTKQVRYRDLLSSMNAIVYDPVAGSGKSSGAWISPVPCPTSAKRQSCHEGLLSHDQPMHSRDNVYHCFTKRKEPPSVERKR